MNASMARRIRNAEAILIAAIDRNKDGHRVWSQQPTAQPQQHAARFSGPIKDENRMTFSPRARCGY
jgi:hypothetical protein